MLVVNYRNEPVGLRVFDPLKLGPDGNFGTQADGDAGDLAMALSSGPIRAIPQLNVQPVAGAVAVPAIPIFDDGIMNTAFATTFPPPVNVGGVEPGDPFTPMMRTRAGDTVRVKIQGGGHEHEHDATIHGVKWLQSGSAHGRAPNSGWRNAQSDGISEQFTFRAPVVPDNGQVGNVADLAYSMDASQDGWWSGVWGILRNNNRPQNDLYELDNGINGNVGIANDRDLVGVCPEDPDQRNVPANLREYDVTAVLANEVLGNAVGATIPANTPAGPRAPGFFANDNEGGLLNTAGGTLVYNRRGGGVAGISDDATFNGPLHDPTAILYVRTQDLVFDPACLADGDPIDCRTALGNPTGLQPGAPVEPLVLRANAGDCVEVTLRNALPFDVVNVGTPEAPIFERVARPLPDLAGFNTQLPMVIRNRGDLIAVPPVLDVTSFNNNLVRPSSRIGLHAQLVEYDVTSDDGAAVGQSSPGQSLVDVGSQKLYRWYAGDIEITGTVRRGRNTDVVLGHTPIEFGGTNLIPSDKIKQGQKGMIGALVIEPADATWPEDDRTGATNLAALETTTHDRQGTAGVRRTRADMLVTAASTPKGSFNDLVVSVQKGLNPRYGDGTAVPNIAGEGGLIPEDSHDAGGKAVNYGTEPPWFRFGQPASTPFGALGLVANPEDLHANALAGEDPATPVFTATVGTETRMRVMEATGVGRGTTFSMHGHVWQRDPYGCLQDPANPALGFKTVDGLLGRCETTDVGSEAIGDNPIGMWLGGQESIMPYTNFEIRLESTGGEVPVTGDYLFRDQASFGHSDGIWGILRVAPAP
jgi:hypothetical protein